MPRGVRPGAKKWWRAVHIASYGVVWLVSIHGALAGTDASRALYTVPSIAALAAIVFAVCYRIPTRDLPKRRPTGARKRRSPVPSA